MSETVTFSITTSRTFLLAVGIVLMLLSCHCLCHFYVRDDAGPNYHFNASVPVNSSVSSFWRRGYYSSVSYMDSNVGKVLDTLDELGFTNDTVVALIADRA